MTAEGEGVATRAVRVRLDGTASESDVGALKKWLEREKPLEELVGRGDLRIEERAGTDARGTPMGVGTDIVLVLIGAGAETLFKELLAQVKSAVGAWRDNRGSVENGDPPDARVDSVDPDER
ncbi:hypothetical protein ABZV34_06755 [Streptomyces sp. NPDC005195]|uniref:hypothetical protein n=1 Tax=Streptomyces sp. NPDC005195 TaxID=3154561 RepID=UPI0033AF58D6